MLEIRGQELVMLIVPESDVLGSIVTGAAGPSPPKLLEMTSAPTKGGLAELRGHDSPAERTCMNLRETWSCCKYCAKQTGVVLTIRGGSKTMAGPAQSPRLVWTKGRGHLWKHPGRQS